jgi:hypothetical protein
MSEYDVGSLVRVTGTFKDSTGAVTDPALVQFKYLTPAGAATTYVYGTHSQLVKDSTGVYHVDVTLGSTGTYRVRFESSGTGQASQESSLVAKYTSF